MTDRTEEEVREEHVRKMGPDLGAVYDALYIDVSWLHMQWALYRQLFAQSPKRIELLNETAAHFFAALQETLLEDVILKLAKLTDFPKSAGKDNLTIERLPGLISDDTLRAEVSALNEVAQEACSKARDRRNRHLAHRDLALALATSKDPLPGISRADIEAALQALRNVLNKLANRYLNTTVAYELFIANAGDANALVYYLNKGLHAERAYLDRLQSDQLLPADMVDELEI